MHSVLAEPIPVVIVFIKSKIKYLHENNIEVLTIPLENYTTDDYPKFAFTLCSLKYLLA